MWRCPPACLPQLCRHCPDLAPWPPSPLPYRPASTAHREHALAQGLLHAHAHALALIRQRRGQLPHRLQQSANPVYIEFCIKLREGGPGGAEGAWRGGGVSLGEREQCISDWLECALECAPHALPLRRTWRSPAFRRPPVHASRRPSNQSRTSAGSRGREGWY